MWTSIWTAVGALAALVVAVITVAGIIRRKRRRRAGLVFLSMQMSDLNDDEYVRQWNYLIGLVRDLRRTHTVEFYNETVSSRGEFREASFDADEYLRGIARCDCFVAIISAKVVSSIYFEVGYALALNKAIVVFVGHETHPPLLVRKTARLLPRVKMISWQEMSEIGPQLAQVLRTL